MKPFLKTFKLWLQAANQIISTVSGIDSSHIIKVEYNVFDSNCYSYTLQLKLY